MAEGIVLPTESNRAASIPPHSNSGSVVSKSRKRKNRKKNAKQWTYHVDVLKSTIDSLYEICRTEHSVIGCKEAIMYLQNSTKDFESLIASINVELSWDKEEPHIRHQAVAWEIRKSMGSPSHVIQNSTQRLIDSLPITAMVAAAEVVRHGREEMDMELIIADNDKNEAEAGWQLVRSKRRRSTSSTTASEFADREMSVENDQQEPVRMSVYDRLSGSVPARRLSSASEGRMMHPATIIPRSPTSRPASSAALGQGRLTCPRSAMDLPQTKASMAKMAYSRQLLWERKKPSLEEMVKAKKKSERARRPAAEKCGLHFADPTAVRKGAQEFNEHKRQMRQKSAPVSEHNRSLQCIREAAREVEDDRTELVPADPKPTSTENLNLPQLTAGTSTMNEHLMATRSEPACGSRLSLDALQEMEGDPQWREMTEEEESLALEEQSLNHEIQQEEMISIDAELERQVAEEAAIAEAQEKAEAQAAEAAEKKEQQRLLKITMKKIQDEIRGIPWSELMAMEKEYEGRCHEPGSNVEKHEKMSSPSRRRCDKDDTEFSRKHEEKLKRANDLREQLQQKKTAKLRELWAKVEEVRSRREELIEKKKALLDSRMERAQENREKNIIEIVRKARDDEQKVLEVQFINNLQGGNMRHDLKMRDACVEERRQTMADERAKRMEEKAAKEQAAEERRRQAEQERVARLQEMVEKKEARQAQIVAQKSEQDRERKEKRRRLKERMDGLRAGAESELQKAKLLEKLEATTRTHNSLSEDHKLKNSDESKPLPNLARWEISDPAMWPSNEPMDQWMVCKQCVKQMHSEMEAMAHILSTEHLEKSLITVPSAEKMELEMSNLFMREISLLTDSDISDRSNEESDQEEASTARTKIMALTNSMRDRFNPPPVSKPSEKSVSDILSVLNRCDFTTKLEEVKLKKLERILTEISGFNKDKAKLTAVGMYLAVNGGTQSLFKCLLHWTKSGASLRLLVKVSALLSQLAVVPSVCHSILLSGEMVNAISQIHLLIESDPSSAHLSVLLDVIYAVLAPFAVDNLEKVSWSRDDGTAVMFSVAGYMNAVRLTDLLRTITITPSSVHLLSRVCNLMQLLPYSPAPPNSERLPILSGLVDVLLLRSVECLRAAASCNGPSTSPPSTPKKDSNGEMASNETARLAMISCEKMAENQIAWMEFLSCPLRSFRLILVLGYCLSIGVKKLKDGKGTMPQPQLDEMHRCIKLVSRFAAMGSGYQLWCLMGNDASILHHLCQLPLVYLVRSPLSSLLLPALIAITHGNTAACQIMAKYISCKHLITFVQRIESGEESDTALSMVLSRDLYSDTIDFYKKFIAK